MRQWSTGSLCNIHWSYSYDCCLWFITCRNRLLSGYGIRLTISVLFAVLAALTLLPALISIFHKSIKIKDKPSKSKDPKDHPWAKFIVGKPVIHYCKFNYFNFSCYTSQWHAFRYS